MLLTLDIYQIGVCGGWVFTKTWDICVHGPHQKSWNFVSELGLEEDTSFRVQDDCEEVSLPSDPPQAQPFTGGVSPEYPRPPHHDYVDRTDLRGRGEEREHVIHTGALYRQPLLNSQGDTVSLVTTLHCYTRHNNDAMIDSRKRRTITIFLGCYTKSETVFK